ncbi:hypothetical protein [Rhabdaerophilum sp. SD176]|uniref:hypothetical protein n=1 Tax=Rhabdaerophilum sp. SD176 TaxID=2983548 RepID=UPI0024DFC9A9|nr:hypothetical protein [Rhabdaerophilum sp. SD176]
MIRPSRSTYSSRLLAAGHFRALLVATALSPLALPLIPDQGAFGIVAAQAQQNVAIDKIELPMSGSTLVLNGLTVTGSSLGKAEIEGLFKVKTLNAAAELLQRFNADKLAIATVEFRIKSDIQDVLTVYEGLEATRIKGGAIEKLAVKGGRQSGTVKAEKASQKLETQFGRLTMDTLDLAGMVRWMLDADPTGKAPMKTLHGRYELASMDMVIEDVKVSIGKMTGSGFQARLARKAPIEFLALAEKSNAKPGDPAVALPLLAAVTDMYSGLSFGNGEIDGFTLTGKDKKTGADVKGSGGKMTYTGGAAPSFIMNDFSLAAADGFMKFKKLGFEGDFYSWMIGGAMQAMQGELAGKPGDKPSAQAEEFRTLLAEVGKSLQNRDVRMVFEGLDADLPPGKNAKSKDRVKLALGAFDARMGGFVGMVPTKIDYSLNGFRMPVPSNSKDQGLMTLRELGIDVIDLSMKIKGTWDEAKTRFVVDDVNADMGKMAKVGLKAEVGNIPRPLFENPMTAWTYTLLGANAQSLSFAVENRGGIDKLIAKAAKDQKKTADQFKMELSAIAPAMIGMYLGGHPDGPSLADALTKFVRTPGTLNITLRAKSPGGLTAMELMAAGENPGALLQKVKIDAEAK